MSTAWSTEMSWKLGSESRYSKTWSSSSRIVRQPASSPPTQPKASVDKNGASPTSEYRAMNRSISWMARKPITITWRSMRCLGVVAGRLIPGLMRAFSLTATAQAFAGPPG
ncbi:MAG: hypothetical protein ACRDY2_06350 [Acidimicrobiales bacterium]